MKTETPPTVERTASPSIIDTSKMSPEQRAALEMTEAAREAQGQSFAGGLFMGRFDFDALHPYPVQRAEDHDQGDAFLERLGDFLKAKVDPDEIDRTGEIPDEVFAGLAKLGAFGIKISPEYGGLGLSQTNYCRAAMLLGSYCGNLTALISAHQSIGVPQPLILFGTEEQKRRFLPRVAGGEVSAFALTEPKVGSDPAKMETRAEPTDDGSTSSSTARSSGAPMASRPACSWSWRRRRRRTAATRSPRSSWTPTRPAWRSCSRCRFMGLKALYNAVVRFHDVKVPRENIILAEGQGPARRAHHAEHRPAHAPRRLHGRRQALPRDHARLGQRARAMGRADRQARRHRRQDRAHGRRRSSPWKR